MINNRGFTCVIIPYLIQTCAFNKAKHISSIWWNHIADPREIFSFYLTPSRISIMCVGSTGTLGTHPQGPEWPSSSLPSVTPPPPQKGFNVIILYVLPQQ